MRRNYLILLALVVVLGGGVVATKLMPTPLHAPIACTTEARQCPDGSAVGRSGPDCAFAACPTVEQWPSYFSGKPGFTIHHPSSFSVNSSYQYQAMGPGREIPGVSFTIPAGMTIGTNLSQDSYLSVETMATSATCTVALFLDNIQSTSTATENGVEYEVAHGGGAGAGNFYDETVYRIPGYTCTAIRYLIHSTNIGNYEPGAVREFDRSALVDLFDQTRRSYQAVQ